LGRVLTISLGEACNLPELFRGDLEGTQTGGVIVDLAGGDDLVGAGLLERAGVAIRDSRIRTWGASLSFP
jgi:hypothetical protein